MKAPKLLLLGLALWASTASAESVSLRDYLPAQNQVVLSKANGKPHARYTFTRNHSGFQGLYRSLMDIGKAGQTFVWQKEYMTGGAWCTKTYAIFFLADDGSVTEVGDWLANSGCAPSMAFGYRTGANVPTGLVWSPAGTLNATPSTREMAVHRQATPNAAYENTGHFAYSKVGLVSLVPEMTVGHRVFKDVAHVVMYHGTQAPIPAPVRCANSPIRATGVYYQSYKNYNSYAIELWLAKGIGVIKESTSFIEDAAYWGLSNCNGRIFSSSAEWDTALTATWIEPL